MLFSRRAKTNRQPSRKANRVALQLETLEDRAVPATVMNSLDSGPGSLRDAIMDANTTPGADTITFHRSVRSITLDDEIRISDDVTIQGSRRLQISGGGDSRIFNIESGTVSISYLRIVNGLADETAPDFAGFGGAILNQDGADLTLNRVEFLNNLAQGDSSVVDHPVGGYLFTGVGAGGAISNMGTLTVSNSTFRYNEANGGDGSAGAFFTLLNGATPSFPGMGVGGAIHNIASAEIYDTRFYNNSARGGDGASGSYASLGLGGAVYNDSSMIVDNGLFLRNQARGGNDSTSNIHNGHGIGGALASGTTPLFTGRLASLTVTDSSFYRNLAQGGDRNEIVPVEPIGPLGISDLPSTGFGGAVFVFQGQAHISDSQVHTNQTVGGQGATGQDGGPAFGGGISVYHFNGSPAPGIGLLDTTIENTVISRNFARGGNAGAGGDGGIAHGGGISSGKFGSLFAEIFGSTTSLTLTDSLVARNQAAGGRGVVGGHGIGGGISNDVDSVLDITDSTVSYNRAVGGRGLLRGTNGLGIHGGIFSRLVFDIDSDSELRRNTSSVGREREFHVTGGGDVPTGLGLPNPTTGVFPITEHNGTGNATFVGNYTLDDTPFEILGITSTQMVTFPGDVTPTVVPRTLTFRNVGPNNFVAANGDILSMDYGRGPAGLGITTLTPNLDAGNNFDGTFTAVFLAEFTPRLGESTGRYANVNGGSFMMTATINEPVALVPDLIENSNPALGEFFTVDVTYTWEGNGWLSFGHRVPFAINGGGSTLDGFPLPTGPGGNYVQDGVVNALRHISTGTATYLGEHTMTNGVFEALQITSTQLGGAAPLTIDFQSGPDPLAFTSVVDGSVLALTYGNPGTGPSGVVTLTFEGLRPGDNVPLFSAVFVAEFNAVPGDSDGKFDNLSGGSFIMVARTVEPLALENFNGTGRTDVFDYTWKGNGWLTFN